MVVYCGELNVVLGCGGFKPLGSRADLGAGPGAPAPPFVWELFFLNISALHVQYGIQAFAF